MDPPLSALPVIPTGPHGRPKLPAGGHDAENGLVAAVGALSLVIGLESRSAALSSAAPVSPRPREMRRVRSRAAEPLPSGCEGRTCRSVRGYRDSRCHGLAWAAS